MWKLTWYNHNPVLSISWLGLVLLWCVGFILRQVLPSWLWDSCLKQCHPSIQIKGILLWTLYYREFFSGSPSAMPLPMGQRASGAKGTYSPRTLSHPSRSHSGYHRPKDSLPKISKLVLSPQWTSPFSPSPWRWTKLTICILLGPRVRCLQMMCMEFRWAGCGVHTYLMSPLSAENWGWSEKRRSWAKMCVISSSSHVPEQKSEESENLNIAFWAIMKVYSSR